jgi:hypothetical protein
MNPMMLKSPMHTFLEQLLDNAETPGEIMAVLQFKLVPQVAKGALRRAKGADGDIVDGMFELLSIAQENGQGPPFPLHQFFEASEISRVMVVGSPKDLPAIVAPPSPSGIYIPQ